MTVGERTLVQHHAHHSNSAMQSGAITEFGGCGIDRAAYHPLKENLDKKTAAELSSRGTLALQATMETQVSSDVERLKDCLTKIR